MAWVDLQEEIAQEFDSFNTPDVLPSQIFRGDAGGVGVIHTRVYQAKETTTDQDLALLRAELERLQALTKAQKMRALERMPNGRRMAAGAARARLYRAGGAPAVRSDDTPTARQTQARETWRLRRAQQWHTARALTSAVLAD